MTVAVIDFETYYDQEYTLTKMTTEAYVRDSRFKIHCVAVVTQHERRVITENFFQEIAPYMLGMVVCHHAQFDGMILSHHLGLFPAKWGDTLSMARAQLQNIKSHSLASLAEHFGLPAKTIEYDAFKGKRDLDPATLRMLTEGCLHDADLTLAIFNRLIPRFPVPEMGIVDQTIRMFTEPCLLLDEPRIAQELSRVQNAKANALERLGVTREILQSSTKFAQILSAQGVEVPMKWSGKQEKLIPALAKNDEGMKELLAHENASVAALAAARLGEKSTLLETRCERLLGMSSRGYLPVYLKYHGAHTGRWSGGDKVNFQNFPRGSEIRKALIAPDGYKLVGADSAQVECRLLNWFAQQHDVLDAFRTGRDLYCENATTFFGRPITKENKDERQFGKVMELGLGYGCGAPKFKTIALQQAKTRLDDADAARAVTIYRTGHPNVCATWYRFQDAVRNMGQGLLPYSIGCARVEGYRIYMPDDTFLDYEGMYFDGEDFQYGKGKLYGGLITENVIQKLGLLVISNVIRNITEKYKYKLVMTTHDEIVFCVPENDVQATDNIFAEMVRGPEWCPDLPLGADTFEGKTYGK